MQQLRPMPAQKSSSTNLLKKDNNKVVRKSVPSTSVEKNLYKPRQSSIINMPSLTESDTKIKRNDRRTSYTDKKKRALDSDDENDPEFRLNEKRNQNISKNQTKTTSTNLDVPDTLNIQKNNQIYESEERNLKVENHFTIKNELDATDNILFDKTEEKILIEADEYRKLKIVSDKFREILILFAQSNSQMHAIANSLRSFNLEKLSNLPIDQFFMTFIRSQTNI
ncbi:unnamed protein product [Brachionus calyciflorus]|uniref:Uncharacterized protein n=1 Tax=Brachionus calyciflorus TaxID=104777 RepID=A0A814H9L1_9BILA|nr:unnamed protein product [Brachionus calyciflorus]